MEGHDLNLGKNQVSGIAAANEAQSHQSCSKWLQNGKQRAHLPICARGFWLGMEQSSPARRDVPFGNSVGRRPCDHSALALLFGTTFPAATREGAYGECLWHAQHI